MLSDPLNLPNSLSIPADLHNSLFLILFICGTPLEHLKHFNSRTFTFPFSALLKLHASAPNAVGTITPSYRHFFTYIYCFLKPIKTVRFCPGRFGVLFYSVVLGCRYTP